MPPAPPAPPSRPTRPIFFVLLLVVVAVGVVQLGRWAFDESVLVGSTGQRAALVVELDEDGGVRSLRTEVLGQCAFGSTWPGTWEPDASSLPDGFRREGPRVEVRERASLAYSDGSRGEIDMALSGTVTSGSASGTVRMKVRFYEGDEESGACDSGDVTWRAASGPMPRVVGLLPEIRPVGRYLAPAPSLAGPVSPQRRRFADSVDNTCAREYNEIKARRAEASRLYGGRDGADRLVWATFVDGHEAEVRELRALGDPPEAQSVYRAWLENMAGRASLERRMVGETYSQALATYAQIVRMKAEANHLARRFGLTVCSSNSLPWTPRGPASPPDDLVGGPPV